MTARKDRTERRPASDPGHELAWRRVLEEVKRFPREIRELPVGTSVTAEAMRREIARYDFREPMALPEAVEDL
ncbi:MAG: hypothetical protein PVG07_07750, partial [Acidobacteriota bacterium]